MLENQLKIQQVVMSLIVHEPPFRHSVMGSFGLATWFATQAGTVVIHCVFVCFAFCLSCSNMQSVSELLTKNIYLFTGIR